MVRLYSDRAEVVGGGRDGGEALCNRGRLRARATTEATVASSFKLSRFQSFPLASQPASQPYQPGSCLQRPHRGTDLVFVIVLSQPRHDPLTHPRNCGRLSRACFCGRLPFATLLAPFRVPVAPLPVRLPAIITATNSPHNVGSAQATGATDRPKYTIHVGRLRCPLASKAPS